MDPAAVTAFSIIAGVGAFSGFLGGFFAGSDHLIGTTLIGAIGGIALSAIFRIAGWPAIYSVGADEYSLVWGAVGGFLLGFVVGRSS
jgi:hypothetical protein